ncbi:mucin 12, cell surface associated [Varicellaria rhodocarpa]|nr:mucin 12, cell surface associated [Varicellaria rhodocarpa]
MVPLDTQTTQTLPQLATAPPARSQKRPSPSRSSTVQNAQQPSTTRVNARRTTGSCIRKNKDALPPSSLGTTPSSSTSTTSSSSKSKSTKAQDLEALLTIFSLNTPTSDTGLLFNAHPHAKIRLSLAPSSTPSVRASRTNTSSTRTRSAYTTTTTTRFRSSGPFSTRWRGATMCGRRGGMGRKGGRVRGR